MIKDYLKGDNVTQEKLQCIEKLLLALTIILIPFVALPKWVMINAIGTEATNYILLILFTVFICECIKYKIKIKKKFLAFVIAFTLIRIVSLIIGLAIFPYYDLITIEQISKLQTIVGKFPILGSGKQLLPYWLFLKESKNIIFDNLTLFGLPIIMWHLFHNNWKRGFLYLRKAVLMLVGVFSVYSIIEILWLKLRLNIAKDILCFVNPFLYELKSAHGWWPPLLWEGQLRSICPEPSFFGIYACFCIPFLWTYLFNKQKVKYIVLYTYFILMLFLTNARTALGIYIGECSLLIISTVLFRTKKWFMILITILFSTVVAFCITSFNYNNEDNQNNNNNNNNLASGAEQYIEQNVASVAKPNARSNGARFANMKATFAVAKDHVILGVGNNLKDAYIRDYLTDEDLTIGEVALWTRYMQEQGVLKSGYPKLNQYINIFVDSGIIGLIMFLTPIAYVLLKFKKKSKYIGQYDVCIMILFIGQLIAMIANRYHITYPLALGLCLCMVENQEENKKENQHP